MGNRIIRRLGRSLEQGVFAPFLLGVQPVLQLFLINITEMDFGDSVRSLIVVTVLVSLVYTTAYFFLHNSLKAGLCTSPFVVFFFLFGDLADRVSKTHGLGPARTDFLVLMFVITSMVIWVWLVYTHISNLTSVNLYFNLLSVVLLANSGIQVRNHLLDHGFDLTPENRIIPVAMIESSKSQPDIYYIILDGYGRQDVLEALYDFDNSDFLTALKNQGFYVAEQAASNYIQTLLSVSSSLNMEYIQDLNLNDNEIENRGDLIEILNFNEVRTVLANRGYQTISFSNEYKATISSADIYYDDQNRGSFQRITAFESMVINRSMARILMHIPAFNQAVLQAPYEFHRAYIRSAFEQLKEIPFLDGEYFIYAHIIAPHPPFVFDQDGQVVFHTEPFTLFDANYYIKDHSRREYIEGYRNQLLYINSLLLETVKTIIERSETPPIIIVQGDHGPGAYLHWGSLEETLPIERFSILNAYYFPRQDYALLHSSISPVNSFRVILNQFFAGTYTILPDQHYYSTWSFPFDFIEVTELSMP